MFGPWEWSYRQVGTGSLDGKEQLDGEESFDGHHPRETQRSRLLLIRTIVFAVLTICVIATLAALFPHRHGDTNANTHLETHVETATKTNGNPHLCGNSSAEAISLGCSFDQLTWSWLPKECPHYANDDFLLAEEGRPWKYYEDPHGQKEVDDESWAKVLEGELMIFGERREHVTHCIYNFLSLAQIIRDGTRYTPKLVEYGHMHHCAMLVLDIVKKEKEWNTIQTLVGTVSYDQSC